MWKIHNKDFHWPSRNPDPNKPKDAHSGRSYVVDQSNKYPQGVPQQQQPNRNDLFMMFSSLWSVRDYGKEQLKQLLWDNYPNQMFAVYDNMITRWELSLIRMPSHLIKADIIQWSHLIKKSPWMIPRSPESLESLDGVFVLKKWREVIWGIGTLKTPFSFLTKWEQVIYERIWLVSKYKDLSIGAYLLWMCNKTYLNELLYGLTTKDHVKRINESVGNKVESIQRLQEFYNPLYEKLVHNRGKEFDPSKTHMITMNPRLYHRIKEDIKLVNWWVEWGNTTTPILDVQST